MDQFHTGVATLDTTDSVTDIFMEVFKLDPVAAVLGPTLASESAKVSAECTYDPIGGNGQVVNGGPQVGGGHAPDYGLTYYDPQPKKEDFEERPPCIFTPPQMTPDTMFSGDHKEYPPHYSLAGEPSPPGSAPVVSSGLSAHSPSEMTILYEQKPTIGHVGGGNCTKPSQSKSSKSGKTICSKKRNG